MHAVVIGAGIVGLSAAYELGKAGYAVTVVDAALPGQGSTVGSAAKIALAETPPVAGPGMVKQGIKWMLDRDSPLYIRPSLAPGFVRFMVTMARHCNLADFRSGLQTQVAMAATCLETFDEWTDEGLTFEQHRRGVILAYEHDESFAERRTHDDVFARFGYVPDVLDYDALHAKEPALSSRIRHGLYYDQDGQLEPQSITNAFVASLVASGHRLVTQEPVIGFDRKDSKVTAVRTQNRRLECDVLVIAAGVHSGPLSHLLGSYVPIRPGKGYSIDYPDSPTGLKIPLTFEDAHVAVSPLNGGLRVAGTMEFAGFDTTVRPRRVAAMKASAVAGFGDWDPNKSHAAPWAGLRPMTPDGLPVIGMLPGYTNTVMASGHAMLGLTLAPATSKAVVALVSKSSLPTYLAQMSPARFRRGNVA